MPELDGKKYKYTPKGIARFKEAIKKLKDKKGKGTSYPRKGTD